MQMLLSFIYDLRQIIAKVNPELAPLRRFYGVETFLSLYCIIVAANKDTRSACIVPLAHVVLEQSTHILILWFNPSRDSD